jgi:predicted esterase YcpF (UPF0227 family)
MTESAEQHFHRGAQLYRTGARARGAGTSGRGTAAVSCLVYLHGFRSSPSSVKAQRFVRAVDALPTAVRPRLHVPVLPADPAAAVDGAAVWIERELGRKAAASLTLVGSSLGGFYATHLAERFGARAVLINPAVRPYDELQPGPHVNMYTGEVFEFVEAHFDALRALVVRRITRPERYFLLVRTGDEVLDFRAAVAYYGGAWQYVLGGGDHGWADFDAEIPSVLRFAGVALD